MKPLWVVSVGLVFGKSMKSLKCLLLSFALLWSPVGAQEDIVSRLVLPKNPATPSAFMEVLKSSGMTVNLHTVANRGACNPALGSYSIFGDAGQDLSFGIFVEPDKEGALTLQEDLSTRLLVEVIARDEKTGLKNFWELIGEKTKSQWYYRGNSLDILADIETINMGPKTPAQFGKRLRCSGCHTGGDLVMKELFPYNDWRVDQALDVGPYTLSEKVTTLFDQVQSAHHFSELVHQSLKDYVLVLETHSPETSAQWMRSVLAPLEMNLASDTVPFEERQALGQDIEIPAAFFVDPLLTGPQPPIRVPSSLYKEILLELGSTFAAEETPDLLETQHAFLVPVRSRFDTLRVESLLRRGLLDEELLTDLLAVDWQQNLYSPKRLELMSLLPENWETAGELRSRLLSADREERSQTPAIVACVQNLKDPSRTAAFHRTKAELYLQELRGSSQDKTAVIAWLNMAAQRRREIQNAETSSSPRGSILEGGLGSQGFRRIFPQYREI